MLCLRTTALGTTDITQKHTPSSNYIKPYVMAIFSVPKTWHRNSDHRYGRNNDVITPHVYAVTNCV